MNEQTTNQNPPIPSASVTAEMIAGWKEKYGKVFKYETPDGKACFFRPVDRATYSAALSKVGQGKVEKFNDTIITNIWLAGDEEIRKVDQYYFGLIDQVEELMNKVKGYLGEL
jgi:hypothetical protein